jgi:hypothetical protein
MPEPQPNKPEQPAIDLSKVDWSKWGTPLAILLVGVAIAWPQWSKVDPPGPPLPPPAPVVVPVKPTIEDSIARRNGVRDDSIKAPLVELTKIGNGTYTLAFEPDKKAAVVWTVVVSDGVSPVPPKPVPPGPGPGPNPPEPTPLPGEGFRVLVVYENDPSDPAAVLTKEQRGAMSSQAVRGYLDSKCAKGKDGKTPEWRMWDQHVDATNETDIWKDAMKLPRNVLPWIVISNGKDGYSGPFPANEAELLALLRKYGG